MMYIGRFVYELLMGIILGWLMLDGDTKEIILRQVFEFLLSCVVSL